MHVHSTPIIAITVASLSGIACVQTAVGSARASGRVAADGLRDVANAVRGAAPDAVKPGDQNTGRYPGNRSGGAMGTDNTMTASSATGGRRRARADRG